MRRGNALIGTAIEQAVGRIPDDVIMNRQTISGRAAPELASLARGGDLLVLGSRRRRLRRIAPGSGARACARRAECPVVIVPEPSPSVLTASLPAEVAGGHRFRWMLHREAGTAS